MLTFYHTKPTLSDLVVSPSRPLSSSAFASALTITILPLLALAAIKRAVQHEWTPLPNLPALIQ